MTTDRSNVLKPSLDPITSRIPFFYGWVMLPIATLAMVATSPGQTYGISAFNESIVSSLEISQTHFATAYMFGTLIACLPQTLFGAWIDRRGNRLAMGGAAALLGAACFITSMSGPYTIFLSFVLLRMFGQGLLALTASNTLGMWFDRRLGAASALMCAGGAMGVAVVPTISLMLIDRVGWRWAYCLLGVAVWLAVLPLVALLYRNRPEDIGQRPDGDSAPQSKPLERREYSLGEAMRTRAYWVLLGMSVLWSMVGTAIMFHIQPLLTQHGLERLEQANFYTVFAISLGGMQFLGGMLADRIRINWLFVISMLTTTTSIVWLVLVHDSTSAVVFALLFGSGQGLFFVLGQTAWPRFYGRVHLGRIRGSMWTAAVASSSAGPLVSALTVDYLGGYDASLWLFAGLFSVASLAAILATPPSDR